MKKDIIVTMRLPIELHQRLDQVAESLDISKNDLVRHAIRAAVEAAEAADGRLELPIKMLVQPQPTAVVIEKKIRRAA